MLALSLNTEVPEFGAGQEAAVHFDPSEQSVCSFLRSTWAAHGQLPDLSELLGELAQGGRLAVSRAFLRADRMRDVAAASYADGEPVLITLSVAVACGVVERLYYLVMHAFRRLVLQAEVCADGRVASSDSRHTKFTFTLDAVPIWVMVSDKLIIALDPD